LNEPDEEMEAHATQKLVKNETFCDLNSTPYESKKANWKKQ